MRESNGEIFDKEEIRTTLREWSDNTRILFVLDRTVPPENVVDPIEIADAVYFVASTDNFEPSLNLLSRLHEKSPSWRKKTRFIWVMRDEEKVAPYVPELWKLVEQDFKLRPRGGHDDKLYEQGVTRVIHHLRGVSIGVALSGGAAHGMAHLGVLQAFEEEGICIDRIAGTSAGVLTGVLYCAGYSPEWGIHQFPNDLEPGSIYKKLPKGEGFYMLQQYRTHTWEPMLRKYLDDWRLEQCPIPVSNRNNGSGFSDLRCQDFWRCGAFDLGEHQPAGVGSADLPRWTITCRWWNTEQPSGGRVDPARVQCSHRCRRVGSHRTSNGR